MAVSPDHQGHGTGRKLITAALDRARELGARRIDLESNAQLTSAVHLYEAFGFRHLREDEIALVLVRAGRRAHDPRPALTFGLH